MLHEMPSPSGRRAARRLEREEAILQAAKDLMAAQGYDAMTMDDLASRAGITKPTLYQHFPSKEAIAIRVVIHLMRRLREYVQSLDPALPADQKLESIVRNTLQERLGKGKLSIGPAAKAALVPVIRANPSYLQEFEGMVAAVCVIVEQAKAEGTVSPAIPTRLAAQTIFSVMRDSEYEEFVTRGVSTVAEIVDGVTAVLMNGMRTRGGRSGDRGDLPPSGGSVRQN